MRSSSAILRVSAFLAMGAGALSCSDYLTVENPSVIAIDEIDPMADATTLSNSAHQNFATAHGWLIMYSGWFTGETDVSETFPTRHDFGRRAIGPTNTNLNTDLWAPLSLAIASSYIVLEVNLPNPDANLDYVRARHALAWAYLFMAEQFCSGVARGGPELNTAQLLDSAVVHFGAAVTGGNANNSAEGVALARSALVGRARARLQAGQKAGAVTDANAVPAGFTFNLLYFDDLSRRTRLGNRLWQFTADRGSIGVAPVWRVTDPRLKWRLAPSNLLPQDGSYVLNRGAPHAVQDEYPAFNTPIRLASKLEADYIAAEAQSTAAMLTLIQARRSANDQPAYVGPTDAASVLAELEDQRGREFYLEGKRLGDLRRNGPAVRYAPAPGAPYWRPGAAPIGNQTCFPVPQVERDNNPNLSP